MEHTNTKSIPNWAKTLSALPPYMLYVRRAGAARRGGGRRGPSPGEVFPQFGIRGMICGKESRQVYTHLKIDLTN